MNIEAFPSLERDSRPEKVVPLYITADDLLGGKGMYTEKQELAAMAGELPKVWAVISHLNKKSQNKEVDTDELADLASDMNLPQSAIDRMLNGAEMLDAIKEKKIIGLQITSNFLNLTIDSTSTGESIVADYKKIQEEESEQYTVKRKDEVAEKQRNTDTLFAGLSNLDFQNLEKVLEWLNEYNNYAEDADVDTHEQELLKIFEANGYSKETNDKINFMLADTLLDKNRKGEAMVGYILANLGMFTSKSMAQEIRKWKNEA